MTSLVYPLMNNNSKKNTAVPSLRFPEFQNTEGWGERKLSEVLIEHGSKSAGDEEVFSVSVHKGVINQIEHLGRSFSAATTNHYKRVLPHDVIYTKSPTGDFPLGIIKQSKVAVPVIVSPLYGVFTPETSALGYILNVYFESSVNTINYLSSIVQKGAKNTINISNDTFLSKALFLPSNKGEQQKIAACLSSIDDLLTAQSQKIEALKAHKKGLMQQLFPADGETVPVLRFAEFRDTEGWEEIVLLDVTDKKTKWSFTGGPFGSNLKSSDYVPNGIRIIQLQNIGDGEFNNEYKIFTSKEKADELLSCNIYPDDIILSKMGDPVGRACLIPNIHNRYVMCSDGIRLVVDEKRFSKYFIYTIINGSQLRSLVEKTATGSTRKRIGLDDLKNLPMIIPKKLKEQEKISDCLSTIDDLISAESEKMEALKGHKKGLMQQLFPNVSDMKK